MADGGEGVVIIGGGLAGLCCALRLRDAGVPCTVLEASEDVGGRVWTDEVEGFKLDRGFQVFLTSYPESRRLLDMDALQLGEFSAGAVIRRGGKFHRLFDPRRHPREAVAAATSPLLTWGDRLRLLRLWMDVKRDDPASVLRRGHERTTIDELETCAFTPTCVEAVLRPFFAGIFLQRELTTSTRLFRYTFRMFAEGRAALPAGGMQAIPRQLADRVRAKGGTVRTSAKVAEIVDGGVKLATGNLVPARAVVVATEGPEAVRLLRDDADHVKPIAGVAKRTTNVYFATERPPIDEPTLVLNGEGATDGIVNNVTVPSLVQPTYAPAGRHLVSAAIVDEIGRPPDDIERDVRAQLTRWFGDAVASWRRLKIYQIPYALPPQDPPTLQSPERPVRLRPGLYVCGDHRDQASIQGAMVSGRRAAEAVTHDLARSRSR